MKFSVVLTIAVIAVVASLSMVDAAPILDRRAPYPQLPGMGGTPGGIPQIPNQTKAPHPLDVIGPILAVPAEGVSIVGDSINSRHGMRR